MWFAIVTITTVGYGDTTPQSGKTARPSDCRESHTFRHVLSSRLHCCPFVYPPSPPSLPQNNDHFSLSRFRCRDRTRLGDGDDHCRHYRGPNRVCQVGVSLCRHQPLLRYLATHISGGELSSGCREGAVRARVSADIACLLACLVCSSVATCHFFLPACSLTPPPCSPCTLIATHSPFHRTHYDVRAGAYHVASQRGIRHKHVVLVGEAFNVAGLQDFLREFFEDKNYLRGREYTLVILAAQPPSEEVSVRPFPLLVLPVCR